jgi:hypothetical protein
MHETPFKTEDHRPEFFGILWQQRVWTMLPLVVERGLGGRAAADDSRTMCLYER